MQQSKDCILLAAEEDPCRMRATKTLSTARSDKPRAKSKVALKSIYRWNMYGSIDD
jgi:hypothetical protein